MKREKELEREDEMRKGQIDAFFNQLREKSKQEEEKLRRLKAEKEQKDNMKQRLREIQEVQRMKDPRHIPLSDYAEVNMSEIGNSRGESIQ